MEARRYNKNKNRIELLPDVPLELIADVYTKGAHKYSIYENDKGERILGVNIPFEERHNYKLVDDASDNWKKGLSWKKTTGSLLRHILAFRKGEDIDPELGTYHLANAGWNILTLLDHYKNHPELDDRDHTYLKPKKIGLDVDEVLADWLPDWCNYWGLKVPTSWYFDRNIVDKFEKMRREGKLDGFYLNLKPLLKPEDIPFEPHCYVTSRPVAKEITEQWLDMHGFPARPVISVPVGTSKVQVLKEAGVDIFVDDRYNNFVELNRAGVCTFLYDQPHNQRYDVGYKRIKSLKELL